MMRKLLNMLVQGGVLISTTGGVNEPDAVTNPCLGQPLYHAAIGIRQLLRLIDEEGCELCHLEYDQEIKSRDHVFLSHEGSHR